MYVYKQFHVDSSRLSELKWDEVHRIKLYEGKAMMFSLKIKRIKHCCPNQNQSEIKAVLVWFNHVEIFKGGTVCLTTDAYISGLWSTSEAACGAGKGGDENWRFVGGTKVEEVWHHVEDRWAWTDEPGGFTCINRCGEGPDPNSGGHECVL